MADEGRRVPDWAWEEIVLACDLVVQNGWQQLGADNPQVIELSELLQKMDIHPVEVRGDKFRNPNGVGRKTADIANIECHHVEPLRVGGEKARSVKDLALLCSNCHRMIHTKPPWPTPAELRELIRRQADGL